MNIYEFSADTLFSVFRISKTLSIIKCGHQNVIELDELNLASLGTSVFLAVYAEISKFANLFFNPNYAFRPKRCLEPSRSLIFLQFF